MMKIHPLATALASLALLTSPTVFAQAAASTPAKRAASEPMTNKASQPSGAVASAPAEKKPAKPGAQAGPASAPPK
jgi:hypothetical protein